MSDTALVAFEEVVGALETELAVAKFEKSALQLQLSQLQATQVDPAIKIEAIPGEVELLKALLEKLAEELGNEKIRSNAEESRRQGEEEKMSVLLSTLEESRQALARLQAATMPSQRRMSSSENTNRPRRPSLLGAVCNSQHRKLSTANASYGLGFGIASLSDADGRTSTLGAKSHVRNISESSTTSSTDSPTQEAARAAKVRARKLGLSISLPPVALLPPSKSGARSAGLNNDSFDFTKEKRRLSSVSLSKLLGGPSQSSSISEAGHQEFHLPRYDDLPTTPPSAPLRALGRNQSFSFFDDFPRSRRGSSASSYQFPAPFFYTPPPTAPLPIDSTRADSSNAEATSNAGNLITIQGLRIQLAESEEGRRANMVCIQALKDFISRDGAVDENLQLPQLPTDEDDSPVPTSWSTRLPSDSPSLLPWMRSSSTSGSSTCSSAATEGISTTGHTCVPTFGGFSFASLVARTPNPSTIERSPTMVETSTIPPHHDVSPPAHDESSSGSGSESDFHVSSSHSSSAASSICDDVEVEKIAAASPQLGLPIIFDPTATV